MNIYVPSGCAQYNLDAFLVNLLKYLKTEIEKFHHNHYFCDS